VPVNVKLPVMLALPEIFAEPPTTRLLLTFNVAGEIPPPISKEKLSVVIGAVRVTEPPAGEISLIEAAINFSLYS